jgi:hypothetical protein
MAGRSPKLWFECFRHEFCAVSETPPSETPSKGRDNWIEVTTAVVLGTAGLLATWAAYQSALWDSQQAEHYSRANSLRTVASQRALQADARQAMEVSLFTVWLEAQARGDRRLATFYRDRFPDDLRPAFEDWLSTRPLSGGAPPFPFAMPSYRPKGVAEAQRLETQAEATFKQGQSDNRVSDNYGQATVFLGMALFFGGICQVFRIRYVRYLLIAVSIIACASGVLQLISLPTLRPG